MNASVRAASAFSRTWVRVYTAGLPEPLRDARREELYADLWEQQHDQPDARKTTLSTAAEIVLRTCLGVVDDLAWRLEVHRVVHGSSTQGRIPMRGFTVRQTRWMGLAGLVGGLIWAIYLFSLMQRSRGDYPAAPDRVVPVMVAVLLLAGLIGFLASFRERIRRTGTIGVSLLIVAMASYLLANTLLGALPPGTGRNIFGVVLAIGFTIAPIPGFILVGLALEGAARAGAFLVAVVGPAGMVLPSILARFGIQDPPWLRPDAPVNLTFGVYFVLAAAWLASAGYSTYRRAVTAA